MPHFSVLFLNVFLNNAKRKAYSVYNKNSKDIAKSVPPVSA